VRAFLVVRDEVARLPDILRHHRYLGVERFFVVDNGSVDGSLEFMQDQSDVHVYRTTESFSANNLGLTWLQKLMDEHSTYWCLLIDADELFIYPRYEHQDLPAFCNRLDRLDAEGVFAILIDMYSDRPVLQTRHTRSEQLTETCPFFDPYGYSSIPAASFPHVQIYGGARARVFGYEGQFTLSKIPFVRWRRGMDYLIGTHGITPIRMAPGLAALLHFKFLNEFPKPAAIADYQIYARRFESDPDLVFYYDGSTRFTGSDQLLKLGLMRDMTCGPISVASFPKIGRNESCPCGSGHRYKHCHGRIASKPAFALGTNFIAPIRSAD
jgi:glycosyltransferase involved in cell wall biosynthesis